MNTTQTLTTGYRGSKAHAVDTTTGRNRVMSINGEGVSLCGWAVTVGDVEFSDMGSITCRNCAKKAAR